MAIRDARSHLVPTLRRSLKGQAAPNPSRAARSSGRGGAIPRFARAATVPSPRSGLWNASEYAARSALPSPAPQPARAASRDIDDLFLRNPTDGAKAILGRDKTHYRIKWLAEDAPVWTNNGELAQRRRWRDPAPLMRQEHWHCHGLHDRAGNAA